MLKLISPSLEYRDSYLDALKELIDEGRITLYLPQSGEAFKEFTNRLNGWSEGIDLPPGYIPETVYWFVEDKEYIGRICLRHLLTKELILEGGHIGYEIRPSKRNEGYGTKMLSLVLEKAKERGLEKVLITCDEDNVPSRKVIENNGGILENIYDPKNGKKSKLRYWIYL